MKMYCYKIKANGEIREVRATYEIDWPKDVVILEYRVMNYGA